VRLAALAREVRTHRRFERREPKPVKAGSLDPKEHGPPKPTTITRPRVMHRRMPSLPTMPWQDDGR
jgi:hypothetical protein